MTLKRLSRRQVEDLRDGIEDDLRAEVSRQMRGWLDDVRGAALQAVHSPSPNVLLAAAGDEMPGLGTVAGWWAQRVDATIVDSVRAMLVRSFNRWSDQTIDASPAMSATNAYLGNVRDRLVLGSHFGVTVYEDSMDRIRLALATSAADGWTRPQLAARIAAELSWEKDGPYWRAQQAAADAQIDSVLDAMGDPGNPAREWARLNDPTVQHYRDQRNYAIKHLDAERSVWQTRANLIARTEATGGANFGAQQAFVAEGVKEKMWVATGDARTRDSHAMADGQVVAVGKNFVVGNSVMPFPGAPSAPAEEVANCRCAMVAGDYLG